MVNLTRQLLRLYESYFGNLENPEADGVTRMRAVQAVGLPSNFNEFIGTLALHDSSMLRTLSAEMRAEGYLSQAVFYHVLAQLKEESDSTVNDGDDSILVKRAAEQAEFDLDIVGEYRIERLSDLSPDAITILLDWDDTTVLGDGFREGIPAFLEEVRRGDEYQVVFSTSRPALLTDPHNVHKTLFLPSGEKVPLEDLVAGATVVPASIMYIGESNEYHVKYTGKIYNGVLQAGKIDPNRAVVVTDTDIDKSADRKFPLATIVVDKETSAELWLPVIRALERFGYGGSIYDGIRSLHRYGESVVTLPVDDGRELPFFQHSIPIGNDETVTGYTTRKGRDLLYLGSLPRSAKMLKHSS